MAYPWRSSRPLGPSFGHFFSRRRVVRLYVRFSVSNRHDHCTFSVHVLSGSPSAIFWRSEFTIRLFDLFRITVGRSYRLYTLFRLSVFRYSESPSHECVPSVKFSFQFFVLRYSYTRVSACIWTVAWAKPTRAGDCRQVSAKLQVKIGHAFFSHG